MNKDIKIFVFRVTVIFLLLVGINLVSKSNINGIDFETLRKEYAKDKKITKYDMQIEYVKVFFDELINENYEVAYDMLSDETKDSLFSNSLQNFKKAINQKYINTSIAYKEIMYTDLKKLGKDQKTTKVTAYMYIKDIADYQKMQKGQEEFFESNIISFTIKEQAPFKYTLDINEMKSGREED